MNMLHDNLFKEFLFFGEPVQVFPSRWQMSNTLLLHKQFDKSLQ